MMYSCRLCKYQTSYKHHLEKHYTSKKHQEALLNKKDLIKCICGRMFSYKRNYNRHISECSVQLKKNETIEQPIVKKKVITNSVTITCDNNKISKIEKLNQKLNQSNMIDMETFLTNYKENTKYQLTKGESKILLENYLYGGFKTLSFDLPHYLKEKCSKQLEDLKGIHVDKTRVVLPIVATDCAFRSYIKKTPTEWKRESNLEDIKKIIIITRDQIYDHHGTFINLSSYQTNLVAKSLLQHARYDEDIIDRPEYQNKNTKQIQS